MRRSTHAAILCSALILACAQPVLAQQQQPEGAAQAVTQHFEALLAEDYRLADEYFTAAFRRAFKGDVARVNQYYLARFEQAGRGYDIVEVQPLGDPELETAIAVVEFAPPDPDMPVTSTERIYYYLVREEVESGAPGRASDGRAWRIDIFDSFRFDSLADARRRPYLYTREAWPEDEGRELKSRQGLFRIQWALDAFYFDNRHYPLRLLGSDNRRDELIAGDYLAGAYPLCGFDDRPMRSVEFMEKSSGDFTYIGIDDNGDGESEGYWLLLHGKVPSHFYFIGRDTVYILSSEGRGGQRAMAEAFAEYWRLSDGRELALTEAVEPMEPQGSLVPTISQLTGEPVDDGDQQATELRMLSVAYAALIWNGVKDAAANSAITPVAPQPAVEPVIEVAPPPPPPLEIKPLRIYTYGF